MLFKGELSIFWRCLKKNNPQLTVITLILTFLATIVIFGFQYSLLGKQTELTRGQATISKEQTVISNKQATIAQEQNKITLFKHRYELYDFFHKLQKRAQLFALEKEIVPFKELIQSSSNLIKNDDALTSFLFLILDNFQNLEKLIIVGNVQENHLKVSLAESQFKFAEILGRMEFLFSLEDKEVEDVKKIKKLFLNITHALTVEKSRHTVNLESNINDLIDLLQKTALLDVMAKALRMTEVSQ